MRGTSLNIQEVGRLKKKIAYQEEQIKMLEAGQEVETEEDIEEDVSD